MQAKAQALATDADRATTAGADASGASVTTDKLKEIAQRLSQLQTDATQANHEFEQAATAFGAACEIIHKGTAQG